MSAALRSPECGENSSHRCARLFSETQLFLHFAQRRQVNDLTQRDISIQLELHFRLFDDKAQTFLRNIAVRTEYLPGGIVRSRSVVTLHLPPFHQDPHSTFFILTDEAVCPHHGPKAINLRSFSVSRPKDFNIMRPATSSVPPKLPIPTVFPLSSLPDLYSGLATKAWVEPSSRLASARMGMPRSAPRTTEPKSRV